MRADRQTDGQTYSSQYFASNREERWNSKHWTEENKSQLIQTDPRDATRCLMPNPTTALSVV